MIRGIDFYEHTLQIINEAPNIDIIHEAVSNIVESQESVVVQTSSNAYTCQLVFNNIPQSISQAANTNGNGHLFVWQHFKGWFIETTESAFNIDEAIFMDFRVPQSGETRFFYVLPTASNKALVELAIFSPKIPDVSFYDSYLKDYISEVLQISEYKIKKEEVGAIPMTTYNFQKSRTNRVIPIGTNGGSVKASSGYAFTRIQKHISELARHLIDDRIDDYKPIGSRFDLYDRTMLNAILTGKTSGMTVFDKLFSRLNPKTIFKFLDEEGSFFNDLKIFTAPPKLPFIKAFLQELRH